MTDAEQDRIDGLMEEEIARQNGTQPRCPACNSDDVVRHTHRGNFLAPEGSWWECNACGHKDDPS